VRYKVRAGLDDGEPDTVAPLIVMLNVVSAVSAGYQRTEVTGFTPHVEAPAPVASVETRGPVRIQATVLGVESAGEELLE
jgi:hypothetical protein